MSFEYSIAVLRGQGYRGVTLNEYVVTIRVGLQTDPTVNQIKCESSGGQFTDLDFMINLPIVEILDLKGLVPPFKHIITKDKDEDQYNDE